MEPGKVNMSEDTLEWLPANERGQLLQRIEVKFYPGGRAYSFAWGGEGELAIGDKLIAPEPPNWNGPYFGECFVTSLRSGYEGPIRTITKRGKASENVG
jgi:hypothetical protein